MKNKIIKHFRSKGIPTSYSGKLKVMFFFVKNNYDKMYNEMYADEEAELFDQLTFKLRGVVKK